MSIDFILLDRKVNHRKDSDDDDFEDIDDHNKENQRKQQADLAAAAAMRRLSNTNANKPTLLTNVNKRIDLNRLSHMIIFRMIH